MREWKRLVSLNLVLALLLSLAVPVPVFAENAPLTEASSDEAAMLSEAPPQERSGGAGTTGDLNWVLDENGILTVTGQGAMPDYDGNLPPWYGQSILEVVLKEGITTVGAYAFADYGELATVSLPESLTTIGNGAFSGCSGLETLAIPLAVTAIANDAFQNCTALSTVTYGGSLAQWEVLTASCTVLGAAEVTGSHIADGGDEEMGLYWLLDNDGLLTVTGEGDMSAWDGESQPWYTWRDDIIAVSIQAPVSGIGDTPFLNCDNLENITCVDGAACRAVDGVLFSSDQTVLLAYPPVKSGSSYDIPQGVKVISANAFRGSSIAVLKMPLSVASVGENAFLGCDELATVDYEGTKTQWAAIAMATGNDALTAAAVEYPPLALGTMTNGLSWVLSADGVLSVSGEGAMSGYSDCSYYPWYSWRSSVTRVVVESGVTSVGYEAFYNYSALKTVSLPDTLNRIDSYAFYNCYALETIDADTYRLLVTLGSNLHPTSATVNWRTDKSDQVVESWSAGAEVAATLYADGRLVFTGSGAMTNYSSGSNGYRPWDSYYYGIKEVLIGDGITSVGQYAFYNYNYSFSAMTEVTLPGTVTSIGSSAFYSCPNLSVVSIDTYEVLSTVDLLSYFPGNVTVNWLKEADADTLLKTWYVGSVDETDITADLYADGRLELYGFGAFDASPWGSKITQLNIGEGITNIYSSAFKNCDRLTAVELPSTLTVINDSAFYDCDRLETVGLNGAACSIGNSAFYSCGALTAVTGTQAATSVGGSSFESCVSLTTVGALDGVTSVGTEAFAQCKQLKTISLSNAKTIGNSAFLNCAALQQIDLGTSLTTVGKTAFQATGLTSIELPDPIYQIYDNAFYGCKQLKEITIGTGLKYLDPGAFSGCTALEIINWNAETCLALGTYTHYSGEGHNVFLNAGSAGNGITLNLGPAVQRVPAYLFYTGSAYQGSEPHLKAVRVDAGNTVFKTVGNFAFYRCIYLEELDLGKHLTTIGQGAFNTCSALTRVSLPDTLTTLGEKAFFRTALSMAALMPTVNSIGANAFGECAEGFAIHGMSGSYANTYADANSIPFVPYATSGTGWSLENGVLTVDVLPTGEAPWAPYADTVVELNVGENVTALPAGAFAECTELEIAIFHGAMPTTDGTPFTAQGGMDVYYLSVNADSWANADWENCTFTASSGAKTAMTFFGNNEAINWEQTVTGYENQAVDLSDYSKEAQDAYYEYASDANLIAWNTAADGSGTDYAKNGTVRLGSLEQLFAQWKVSRPVTLNLKGGLYTSYSMKVNGMSGMTANLSDYSRAVQNAYQQQEPYAILLSWNTASDGSGVTYATDAVFTVEEDMTLYAQWIVKTAVEVIFNQNNAYSTGARSISGMESVQVTLTDYSNWAEENYQAQEAGATLLGWNTAADGSGTAYARDDVITATQSVTLYAQWDVEVVTVASGTYSVGITWVLTSDGKLELSGTGAMPDYNDASNIPWYSYRSDIRMVTIGEGITRVAGRAFEDYYDLQEVILPSTLEQIGCYAFGWCYDLTAINLPDGVQTIEYGAFQACDALQTLVIPDSVQTIEWQAFYGCDNLRTVTVGSGIRSIGSSAFSSCPNLTGITVGISEIMVQCASNWHDSHTTVTWAPADDTTVANVWEIGADNPADVTATLYTSGKLVISGSGAVKNYNGEATPWADFRYAVRTLVVEEGVTRIGAGSFANCAKLTDVTLPASLEEIGYEAFYGCHSLSSVDIPDGVHTIGNEAFCASDGLQAVTIGSGIQTIEYGAFRSCPQLATITLNTVENAVEAYDTWYEEHTTVIWTGDNEGAETSIKASGTCGENINWVLTVGGKLELTGVGAMTDYDNRKEAPWYSYCSDIRMVTIGEGITRVADWAFQNYYNLREVILPSTLEQIGRYAFGDCYDLTAVNLPDGVQTIEYGAFRECDALQTLVIPDSVQTIEGNAFCGCDNLRTVTVGSGIRSIGYDAFCECSELNSITVDTSEAMVQCDDYWYDSHTTVTWAAGDDTTVANVWYVGTYDETDVTAILYTSGKLVISGTGDFQGNPWGRRVTSVIIEAGITNVSDSAFYGCDKLTSVILGPDVTRINSSAFRDCTAITSVDLGDKLEYIGRYAFRNTGLKEIQIPDSVYGIEGYAFADCAALETVEFGDGLNYINGYAFSNCSVLSLVRWEQPWFDSLHQDSNLFLNSGRAGDGITLRLGKHVEFVPSYLFYTASGYAGQEPKLVTVKSSGATNHIGAFTFYRCIYITEMNLNGITTVGDGAFNSCTALTALSNTDRLRTIGTKAFFRTGLSEAKLYNAKSIGSNAFGECAGDFTLYDYADSYSQTYAETNGVNFVPYATSGTVEGITWSIDTESGLLTVTGTGALPAGEAPWSVFDKQITGVSLNEGITALTEGNFTGCTNLTELTLPASITSICNDAFPSKALETLTFLGDLPALYEDGEPTTDPSPAKTDILIYYFTTHQDTWGAADWTNCVLQAIAPEQYTLVFNDNLETIQWSDSATGNAGIWVELDGYSRSLQKAYYEYASSADLVAWNTAADGSGTAYDADGTAQITADQTLYAQWDRVSFTIDGVAYPVDEDASGQGWTYTCDTNSLELNGYTGGQIVLRRNIRVYADGENNLTGIRMADEGYRLRLYVNGGTTTVTAPDGATCLDASNVYLYTENGAVLDLQSEGYVVFNDTINLCSHGLIRAASSGETALRADTIIFQGNGTVLVTAARCAVDYRGTVDITGDVYLSADDQEPVTWNDYNKGPYFRWQARQWTITLNANGGVWADEASAEKVFSTAEWSISLNDCADLLSRDGYVLELWTDEQNTIEYSIYDSVHKDNAGLTLYAVWVEAQLQVDGDIYDLHTAASGDGWSYTPAGGEQAATLTLNNYAGGGIFFTDNLSVNIAGNASITGTVTKPAIRVLGDLDMNIAKDTVVTFKGGSGESGIFAKGRLTLYNGGETVITGGEGGLGIWSTGNFELWNDGLLTVVGGMGASAIYGGCVAFEEGYGVTILVASPEKTAVVPRCAGAAISLKAYGGANAADAVRQQDVVDAVWEYPYVRIQPKTILLNLNANGGLIEQQTLFSTELPQTVDNAVTLLETEPQRLGYSFTGWNTAADGTGETYAAGETYILASNVDQLTLYATWKQEDVIGVFNETGDLLVIDASIDTGSLLVAGYRADGKMLQSAFGVMNNNSWQFAVTDRSEIAEWKLFTLNENYLPDGEEEIVVIVR